MKFFEIFSFEVAYQLKRRSTWIYCVVIVGLLYLVLDEIVEYATTVEQIHLNSPITIGEIIVFASKFSLLLVAALVADGAMRDKQKRLDQLIFTTPVRKASYLLGRISGTIVIATGLLLIAVSVSVVIVNYVMSLDQDILGTFKVAAFLKSFLILLFPNVIIATLLSYAVALITRQAMSAYGAALVMFLLAGLNVELFPGNWELSKLIDPTGGTILETFSMTLLTSQRNVADIPIEAAMLSNRAAWLLFAILMASFASFRFRMDYRTREMKNKNSKDLKSNPTTTTVLRPVHAAVAEKTTISQIVSFVWFLYREAMTSLTAFGVAAIVIYAIILIPNLSEGPMNVPIAPSTVRVLSYLNSSSLQIFVILLVSIFAGQIIWRERDNRMDALVDTSPLSDVSMMISKLGALMLIMITIQLGLLLSGIVIEWPYGFEHFDAVLYFQTLFGFQLVELFCFGALALMIHIGINQKYLGHLGVLLFYFYTLLAPRIGLEHKLLVFGSDVGLPSSVFYDSSSYLYPWIVFKSYWIGWTVLLLLIGRNLWVRGLPLGAKARFQNALHFRSHKMWAIAALSIIMLSGGVIFYNTNLLHSYKTISEIIEEKIRYENTYGRFRDMPQPTLSAVKLDVDFFPETRSANVKGSYWISNNTNESIDTIQIGFSDQLALTEIRFNRSFKSLIDDHELNHQVYKLDTPLHPGDSTQLNFALSYSGTGFSNAGVKTAVMNDGSYFANWDWLPAIGYQSNRELSDKVAREKLGLPRQRIPSPADTVATMNVTGREQIIFELIGSTSSGQTIVAPGHLKSSWHTEGRNYFHYIADTPIQNIFHVYSANYKVHKSQWKNVPLEIYYRPGNENNVGTMSEAMAAALEYCSATYSNYRSRTLKLVQYADAGTGGISLPGTIGYSTNFAMLLVKHERDFNLPFAVVAHEAAHQWWGHQLVPANVQGAPFLSEGLAWYSALCIVEEEKGKLELEALLDAMRVTYYNPRVRADVPLLQTTDHFKAYRKGPFAMYALSEYIGKENVNAALRSLLHKFKTRRPPLPTAIDLLLELRKVTPDTLSYLLHDLFESNTIWELQARRLSAVKLNERGWKVTLEANAKKEIVDHDGTVTPRPMNEFVEIGIYDTDGKPIYLKHHRIRTGLNQIEIIVTSEPRSGGIDPRNLLIDFEPLDNTHYVLD